MGFVGGSLIGHREGGHLLDLVTEEIDTNRVLQHRREDIDDAAAYREFASAFHHVDPAVGGIDELCRQIGEIVLLPHSQTDGLDAAQPGHLGLKQGSHRGDDDLRHLSFCAAQSAQHLHPSTNGVSAGAQPLVGQCLPGWVVTDVIGAEPRLQGGHRLLGLPEGARHQQHRQPSGTSERLAEHSSHGRAGRRSHLQVESGGTPGESVLHGMGEHRLAGKKGGQSARSHQDRVRDGTDGCPTVTFCAGLPDSPTHSMST